MRTVLLALLFGILAFPGDWASGQDKQQSANNPAPTKLVDVANKICPVSGNPIGSMGPGITHLYHGRIYHLCCGGCIKTFDSDPEKYSKIAESENR